MMTSSRSDTVDSSKDGNSTNPVLASAFCARPRPIACAVIHLQSTNNILDASHPGLKTLPFVTKDSIDRPITAILLDALTFTHGHFQGSLGVATHRSATLMNENQDAVVRKEVQDAVVKKR
jgi:hypothetical protein